MSKGWAPLNRIQEDVKRLPWRHYTFPIRNLSIGDLVSVGSWNKPPMYIEVWLVALGAVPGTVSAQRLNCHHHHHPTEEETEAWKAESVSVKRLRSRKRQPIIAFPLLERDASPLKEVSRQGTWLVSHPGKHERLNHFWRPVYRSSWERTGLVDMGIWKCEHEKQSAWEFTPRTGLPRHSPGTHLWESNHHVELTHTFWDGCRLVSAISWPYLLCSAGF